MAVYYHYEKWEDWQNGMFRVSHDKSLVDKAIELLINPELLKEYMEYVAYNWKHSAEINLTNRSRNHQAWLGQAACCHYANVPEHLTKWAWKLLTDEQRITANNVADEVVIAWRKQYNAETWIRN